MKKALSALLVATSTSLLSPAVASAAVTTTTVPSVATDIAALQMAETSLDTVLGAYADTPAWTARYDAAKAVLNAAEAKLSAIVNAAVPPKPLVWTPIASQTTANAEYQLTFGSAKYYTGEFRATLSLGLPDPSRDTLGNPVLANITWSMICVGVYGLGSVTKESPAIPVRTAHFSVVIPPPPHTSHCGISATYLGSQIADSVTLSLLTTGGPVANP